MELKKLNPGDTFRAKWIDGKPLCTVLSANPVTNLLAVEIDVQEEGREAWTEDGWNLQHTLWGFGDGDYYDYMPAQESIRFNVKSYGDDPHPPTTIVDAITGAEGYVGIRNNECYTFIHNKPDLANKKELEKLMTEWYIENRSAIHSQRFEAHRPESEDAYKNLNQFIESPIEIPLPVTRSKKNSWRSAPAQKKKPEITTKFYSTIVITSLTKNQLLAQIRSWKYFNIRYSGKDRGFYADCIKGKEPIL